MSTASPHLRKTPVCGFFEDTPVISIDPAGIRKRVATPSAKLRCSHIVFAGNAHLGAPGRRLTATLLPTWRYVALTEPLGERLAEAITFRGSVSDTHDIDHFRIVEGDRLLWSSPETTWQGDPRRLCETHYKSRIAAIFPKLGPVRIADAWSGMFGQTVHGMPQIGRVATRPLGSQRLRPSGVEHHGDGRPACGKSHSAGRRPLAVVLAVRTGLGRRVGEGRIAGQAIDVWSRGHSAAAGALSRWRERARGREQVRERRAGDADGGREGTSPGQPVGVPLPPCGVMRTGTVHHADLE